MSEAIKVIEKTQNFSSIQALKITLGNNTPLKKNSKQLQVESEWVEKIRTGDAEAFEKLFNKYCQLLINFSRRYVRDTQIAENIVQDVFLNIWLNRAQLDPSLKIKSYLYTVARNRALKYLRHAEVHRRNVENLDPNDSVKTPIDECYEKEIACAVYQAIEKLPMKCRDIFSMSRFDHLTYNEIAESLNISVKTVETQIGRALKSLRRHLSIFLK